MINSEKYGFYLIILYLIIFALIILLMVFFAESRNYLARIAVLETELNIRLEQAEKEYQNLRKQQLELKEENKQLKEKLEKYETLSGYIEDRFLSANPISKEKAAELTNLFWEQVKLYEFNPWEAAAWIEQESQYKITAVSHKGAIGLTQIMPSTGRDIARRMGIKWQGVSMLFDPEINLRMGFSHLAWGREYSVNEHQTFSMYYWGYGNVKKKGLVETSYSVEIFEKAKKLGRV